MYRGQRHYSVEDTLASLTSGRADWQEIHARMLKEGHTDLHIEPLQLQGDTKLSDYAPMLDLTRIILSLRQIDPAHYIAWLRLASAVEHEHQGTNASSDMGKVVGKPRAASTRQPRKTSQEPPLNMGKPWQRPTKMNKQMGKV